MNAEAVQWLHYAVENLRTAELCLENELYNPCIQNAQQSIEKALKALCLSVPIALRKTHSIEGLRNDLRGAGIECNLTDEECFLLDSVYLPSKYPLGSVLPDFLPDRDTAEQCLLIARKALRHLFAE
ncbi:MAG TPA: HEPN domain-containing protein [bacterium]|nr:HEPN domain-containing protein [bacterium]